LVYLKDVARVELVKFTFSSILLSMENGLPACLFTRLPEVMPWKQQMVFTRFWHNLKNRFLLIVDYNIPFESVTVVKVSMNECCSNFA